MNFLRVMLGNNIMCIYDLMEFMCPLTAAVFISFFVILFSFIRIFFRALKSHSIEVGKWQKVILIASFFTMFFFFASSNYIEGRLRDKITNVVSESFSHEIRGEFIEGKEEFRNQWLELSRYKLYAGSRPTEAIPIKLKSDHGEIILVLKRDSSDINLYWVYYGESSCLSEIGFVRLDFLGNL